MEKSSFKKYFCFKADDIIKCHSREARPAGLVCGIKSGISATFKNESGGDPRLRPSGMTLYEWPSGMTLYEWPSGMTPFKVEALNRGFYLFRPRPARSLCGVSFHSFRAPLRSGFTLIELLVVVLIIGILAAVALPQYNKAVKKAHMAEALTIMDANSKDAQAYLLEHGELAKWGAMISSYADQLDITESGSLHWDSAIGSYFQIGCGDPNPSYANGKDTFYCIRPKNGDKAYIYHFIDKMGKVTRICSGDDCGKYVTGETCFATSNGCTSGASVLNSGCSF